MDVLRQHWYSLRLYSGILLGWYHNLLKDVLVFAQVFNFVLCLGQDEP